MLSTTAPLIAQMILRTLAAAVVGVGSYFFWRYLESKWSPLIFACSLLILITSILSMDAIRDFFSLGVFVVLLLVATPCLFGSLFHYKITEPSETIFGSFLLLFVASSLSTYIGFLNLFSFDLSSSSDNYLNFLYWFGFIVYPSLTPFFLWMSQNMKLQPGTDKHVDS